MSPLARPWSSRRASPRLSSLGSPVTQSRPQIERRPAEAKQPRQQHPGAERDEDDGEEREPQPTAPDRGCALLDDDPARDDADGESEHSPRENLDSQARYRIKRRPSSNRRSHLEVPTLRRR